MKKKISKKRDKIPSKKTSEEQVLNEVSFDKMDFSIVKKIISDYLGEVEPVDEEDIKTSEDEAFVTIEVENLQDGLKKASKILEVPVIELKFKVVDKFYKTVVEENREFLKIEFRKKTITGNNKINISDDKLSAVLAVVYPKSIDGKDTTYNDLLDLIKKHKIKHGINFDNIKNTLSRLKENYDVLTNIVIAQGKLPVKGEDSKIEFSVFSDIDEISYLEKHEKGLDDIFNCSSLDFIKENYFPLRIVGKEELIAITTLSKEGEKGINVFGDEVEAIKGDLVFQAVKNVHTKIKDEKIEHYSDIFGYLEFIDGQLAVHSPLWVSEDFMQGYFVQLPSISQNVRTFNPVECNEQLQKRNITYGIKKDVIETIAKDLKNGYNDFKLILIIEGVKEKKGEDARIELFFKSEKSPGKVLEDGSIDYREIDLVKTVKKNQLLAVKYLAKDGISGKDIAGKTTFAEKGKDKNFIPGNNVRLEVKEEKELYYSTIEGSVTLIGYSGISVNQVYNVKGNVDFSTGNIEFNGSVDIKGDVGSGFKVKAEGDINVHGIVNQGAELISGGNINIKRGVLGRADTKLIAKGSIFAQYIQNSIVEAESDVVVQDYIMGNFVKAGGSVITPDKKTKTKSKGSIMGGETIAKKSVSANSIGSEYTQATKIIVGVDYKSEQRFNDFNKYFEYCGLQISKINKSLKLGFQDANTLMERVKKLPQEKQLPFLNGFKKLNEISLLKKRVLEAKDKYTKEIGELSKSAEVIVQNELFSRVLIQIGEVKFKTETPISKLKIKLGKNEKELEFRAIST